MTAAAIAALYLALACMTVDPLPTAPPEANSLPQKAAPIDRSQIPVICRDLNKLQDTFPSINPR